MEGHYYLVECYTDSGNGLQLESKSFTGNEQSIKNIITGFKGQYRGRKAIEINVITLVDIENEVVYKKEANND